MIFKFLLIQFIKRSLSLFKSRQRYPFFFIDKIENNKVARFLDRWRQPQADSVYYKMGINGKVSNSCRRIRVIRKSGTIDQHGWMSSDLMGLSHLFTFVLVNMLLNFEKYNCSFSENDGIQSTVDKDFYRKSPILDFFEKTTF